MDSDRGAHGCQELSQVLTDETAKYAVLREGVIVGVHLTYAAALRDGYQRFGLSPFMVRQIDPNPPIHFVTGMMIAPRSAINRRTK